jgi:chloramphenicol-sensitive protein RarD
LDKEQKRGTTAAVIAYTLWGFLVLYWKLITEAPPIDIICYRIVWTPVFVLALLLLAGKWRRNFLDEIRNLAKDWRRIVAVLIASLLISINWFTYIFAVNNEQVAEASLGYFMNPLFNFLLSILFLREKLSRIGGVACAFALVGVIIVSVQAGVPPWISITLALTFSLYGLIKKRINLHSYTSLTVETAVMLPFALVYLLCFSGNGFMAYGAATNALMVGAGIATAVPLLLFAAAVPRISYIATGFIQYLSPTISFLLSVFAFNEPVPAMKLAGFAFIWLGLIIFCYGSIQQANSTNLRL